MLAVITRHSIRTLAPRVRMAAPSCYMSSLGDAFEKKGKVEEDRFIRAQDAAKLEAIHAKRLKEAQAAAAASEEDQYNTHIVPVMTEIKGFLSATDKVSDKTLEAIARWKLGL